LLEVVLSGTKQTLKTVRTHRSSLPRYDYAYVNTIDYILFVSKYL
jgi:hypothetical protein